MTAEYKDISNIQGDIDMNAIRGRDDFRKLLAELEAERRDAKK